MNAKNIPGFFAEASIPKENNSLYSVPLITAVQVEKGYQDILPQMRRLTVTNGIGVVYLEYLCARLGGGMSSNPDGSVSCDF